VPQPTSVPKGPLKSLYVLTAKPGREHYTIQVGWNPHHTLFATVAAFDFDPDNPPDCLDLGLMENVFDPAVIVATVEPYAIIPADLIDRLRADMHIHRAR
jgi:hypothetical protein